MPQILAGFEARCVERTISAAERRAGAQGTAGIYGVVDDAGAVRYVGSSNCIEHRAYAHLHRFVAVNGKGCGVKAAWFRQMRKEGRSVRFVVLEECDVGAKGSQARNERERYWIARTKADLNVHMTPLGHAASLDSKGKKLFAELASLREQVKKLTAERDELEQRLALRSFA